MGLMKILPVMFLLMVVLSVQSVSAAGYHIPTVDEGLLNANGCYIGAYMGGDQGANNAKGVNYFQKAQNDPYETQILDRPESYGESVSDGVTGIDTGIESFRSAVDSIKAGSGNKQLFFSRYYNLQYYPDNNYGKIQYQESAPCYNWVEKVLQEGGIPVLILYPWALTSNGVLDMSANNQYQDKKNGTQIMTEIASKCDALSKQYADSKGKPATILICFGLEFNTQDIVNPSKDDRTDNKNKQAWRKMYRDAYTIVHAQGNPSVQMVWAGNVAQTKDDRIWYWPGTGDDGKQLSQDYVDWVGMTWYPWKNGPQTLDSLSGFYNYYSKERKHPLIFMETSADGWGDPATEEALKEQQVSYLYNSNNLKKYPYIKGIIWFNVIKGEIGDNNQQVTKNFLFPDGMWDNHGQSTTTPGTLYSATDPKKMMSSLYPNAVVDTYFTGPVSSLVTSDFGTSGRNNSMTVQFFDASIGSGITSWKWDVDGDQIPEYYTKNATHRYKIAGKYPVSLTISDGTRTLTHSEFYMAEPTTSEEMAFISLGSNPPGAEIWVEQNFIGTTNGAKKRYLVPAGTHVVTLKRTGYLSWTGQYSLKWPQVRDFGMIKLQSSANSRVLPPVSGVVPERALGSLQSPHTGEAMVSPLSNVISPKIATSTSPPGDRIPTLPLI